jgi:hypothetical protein
MTFGRSKTIGVDRGPLSEIPDMVGYVSEHYLSRASQIPETRMKNAAAPMTIAIPVTILSIELSDSIPLAA